MAKSPVKRDTASPDDEGVVGYLPDPTETPALRRALLKLDMFLLPVCTFIYFLNFLDRIALTVTYVPYIVAELPLTLLMKIIGPHIMLPTLVVSWGLVTTFQGFVHNYSGLIAARFFLGLTEGAILPSLVAYLSTFYPRERLGKRLAFFFSATSLAGAFSGLLASAILKMEGAGGKRGWQWIFILEGAVTVVCGLACFWLLPRDAISARYLDAEQKAALDHIHSLEPDSDAGAFSWRAVVDAMKSPQMWFTFIMFFGNGVTLYSLAFFVPTIVQGLGYRGISTQLHSVPPYVCSAVFAIASCYASDTFRHRGSFVIVSAIISIVGYAMFLGSTNGQVLYASLFLQVIGAYTMAPLLSSWQPNNLAPYYKRVTGIAFGFISTNSGGILSTWLFPTTDAPRYRKATWTALGLTISIVTFAVINSLYLARENKKKSRLERHGEGDRDSSFKYIT